MKTYLFEHIWLANSWHPEHAISVDRDGKIVTSDSSYPTERVEGYFIPPFVNAHSHAFQYAMAGTAEFRSAGGGQDDFWSWREAMYNLALTLDPEQLKAIAACVYVQMLRQGITAVCEFHYLHFDPMGKPYAPLARLAMAHIEAAQSVGIDITMIPVLYRTGNFNTKPSPKQIRFIFSGLNQYLDLLFELDRIKLPGVRIGAGVHSLRAAPQDEIVQLFKHFSAENRPLHLHIAEQVKEVSDCQRSWGMRPVAWLSDHVRLTSHMNLVHSTHMDESELRLLAQSPARVVLCPTTEGSLGDGIFPLLEFLNEGGEIAIGSDSHISVDFREELRWLDYQNRLLLRARNVLCRQAGDDSGEILFRLAGLGGRAALGLHDSSPFDPGMPLDGILIDPTSPIMTGKPLNTILSTFIFAAGEYPIAKVMKCGRWLVENGRHDDQDRVFKEFAQRRTS